VLPPGSAAYGPGLAARGDGVGGIGIAGRVPIAVDIPGLVYGGFRYTEETREAEIGSLEMSLKESETVNVPVRAGAGAIVVGGILLLVPEKPWPGGELRSASPPCA
jgi:hypothetical protein